MKSFFVFFFVFTATLYVERNKNLVKFLENPYVIRAKEENIQSILTQISGIMKESQNIEPS